MATITVPTSRNLTAVTYTQGDTISVSDGATLTVDSEWSIRPYVIQALGSGKVSFTNTSTSTPAVYEIEVIGNSAGLSFQQNAALAVQGNWIPVAVGSGAANQILFTTNTVDGKDIGYPAHVEVETAAGSGLYEIWNVVPGWVSGHQVSYYGFNKQRTTDGTIAVASNGAVTGTGTLFTNTHPGIRMRISGMTRDVVVESFISSTSITLGELDGTAYTGGVFSAGTTYFLRNSSCIEQEQLTNQDLGKVLLWNPVTTEVWAGDDTNGTKVPTGANVRIPNTYFRARKQQTTLAAAITGTGTQAITLTAAIGAASNTAYSVGGLETGSILVVNGTTVERIAYTSKTGAVIAAAGMVRGAYGTVAQASFPIGSTVYWIPSATSSLFQAVLNLNPAGTVNASICCFDPAFFSVTSSFSAYASATLADVGCGPVKPQASPGPFDIRRISVLSNTFRSPTNTDVNCYFSSAYGPGYVKGIHTTTNGADKTTSLSSYGVYFITCPAMSVMDTFKIRAWNITYGTGSGRNGFYAATTICATPISNIYVAGTSVRSALTGQTISNMYLAGNPDGYLYSTNTSNFGFNDSASSSVVLRGFRNWSGGKINRFLMYLSNSSQNFVVHNKGYPALDGGLGMTGIANDQAYNTILAHFTVTNPRPSVSNGGSYTSNITANSSGVARNIKIDPVAILGSGSGIYSKGGAVLDMVPGPYRAYTTTVTNAMLPNLTDVQPIAVMTNVAGTTGYLGVGPFSAQVLTDMYTLSGSSVLDNLGRIYMVGAGDSVIVKSNAPNKGFTAFGSGSLEYETQEGFMLTTPPAGSTLEFRMTAWGTPNTGAWITYTSMVAMEAVRAALPGFKSNVGIDIQFRLTYATALAGRFWYGLRMPVVIDTAYSPPVDYISVGISGAVVGSTLAGFDSGGTRQAYTTLIASTGFVKMPYDFDSSVVAYRLVCRNPGYAWIDVSGVYGSTAISIPVSMPALGWYISGSTGVVFDHNTHTITITLPCTPAQVASAYRDSLCILGNLALSEALSCDGTTFITTYTVVLSGPGTIIGSYTDATGLHTLATATLPASGCRVQLYNVTTATELFNAVVLGTSFSYPLIYAAHTLRLRVAYYNATVAKLPQEVITTLTTAGASFTILDKADTVYSFNAVDGAVCTEFTPDFPHLQIDVSDGDGTTSWQRIYAWSVWAQAQPLGIALMFNAMQALDPLNYVLDQSIVDVKFNNISAMPVTITNGYGRRADGTSLIAPNSGTIWMDPGRAYNAGSVPTAAAIAAATRVELAAELARIDAATSSRATVAAIRADQTPELTDATLSRKLAEADITFVPTGEGAGTLHYKLRGTNTDIIPPKNVVGTSQAQASGASQ